MFEALALISGLGSIFFADIFFYQPRWILVDSVDDPLLYIHILMKLVASILRDPSEITATRTLLR